MLSKGLEESSGLMFTLRILTQDMILSCPNKVLCSIVWRGRQRAIDGWLMMVLLSCSSHLEALTTRTWRFYRSCQLVFEKGRAEGSRVFV